MSEPLTDHTEIEKKLVEKYWKPLKFILERQNLDAHEVQDLCQETFLVVIKKSREGGITKQDSIGAFIRSVGMNLMIEHKRKEKRRNTHPTDSFDYIPDALPSTEARFSREQLLDMVISVISESDIVRDKEILTLTYIEGRSKKDICDALDLETNHYDRVIFRAKDRLRKRLESKLGVDLIKYDLKDYLLSVLICVIFQAQMSIAEKNQNNVRDIQTVTHYIGESRLLASGAMPFAGVEHAA